MDYTHLIIGGGIYGCYAALRLAEIHGGARVAIVEHDAGLLQHASYNNQARVHNGYHYPRSILTGLRSRVNAPRFLREFQDAIFTDFKQYYAIARRRSNVTPGQFEEFCRRIGADLRPAPSHIEQLFDEDLIEAVYGVTEYVLDADKLRDIFWRRIRQAGVTVLLETEAMRVKLGPGSHFPGLTIELRHHPTNAVRSLKCDYLYNCTYSRLNEFLSRSGLKTIRLRHEATEIALIDPPPALRNIGVTVMCGPFFSLMPFPPRGLSTISHVSYTPHYGWTDEPGEDFAPRITPLPMSSRFDRMWRDAARYLPALRMTDYVESLWEVKTILPQSDANDSRPILFKTDPAAPNIVSLLGGKIDNIYDLDGLFADASLGELEMSRI